MQSNILIVWRTVEYVSSTVGRYSSVKLFLRNRRTRADLPTLAAPKRTTLKSGMVEDSEIERMGDDIREQK